MSSVLFIDNIPDPVLWIHTFTALFTNIQYSSPDPCKLIYKMVYLLNTQSGSRPEDSNIARIIKNNSDPVQCAIQNPLVGLKVRTNHFIL